MGRLLLQDLPQYIEIDIKEALQERFMDSEALYLRFFRRLQSSGEFSLLEQAAETADWQEALRLAHNLKGVCANLGLNKLSRRFAEMVSLLRGEAFTEEQVMQLLAGLRLEWENTLTYIGSLED